MPNGKLGVGSMPHRGYDNPRLVMTGQAQPVPVQPYEPSAEALTKWDWGLRKGMNQEYLRGRNQPWTTKVGNAALRFIPSVAIKTVQGAAGIAEIFASGGDFTKAVDSDMMTALADAEKWWEDKFPIHKSQQYAEGNLVAKMGTAEFWTQDFADGLEFLASAYLPGTQLTKLGSLTKAVGATKIGKATNAAKLLNKAKAVTGTNTGVTATAAYNTLAEAMIEGNDAYHSIYEELMQKRPELGEKEIKRIAAEAGKKTTLWNMAVLTVPNILQSKWMFGGSNVNKIDPIRANVRAEELVKTALKNGDFELISKFKTKGFGWKDIGKAAGVGIASEGLWEENMQSAIQRYESRHALGHIDRDSLENQFGYMYHALNNAIGFARALPDIATFGALGTSAPAGTLQDEGAMAIALGSMIGAPMSMVGEKNQLKALQNIEKAEKKRWEQLATLEYKSRMIYQDNMKSILAEQGKDDEGKPMYTNKEGKNVVDPEMVRKLVFDSLRNKTQIEEALSAKIQGDPFWEEFNKERSIAAYAHNLASITNDPKDLEDLINLRLVSESQDPLQDELAEVKGKIKEYVDIFNQVKEETSSIEDFSDNIIDAKYKTSLRRMHYYVKSMNKALGRLKDKAAETMDTDNEKYTKVIESLDAMIQDNKEELDFLENNKNTYKEAFAEEVIPVLEAQRKQRELDSALKNKDLSEEEVSKLSKELEVATYKAKEHTKIYGTDTIPNVMGSTFMKASKTFRKFEPRLLKQEFPLFDQAAWDVGNTKLAEQEVNSIIEDNGGKITEANFEDIFNTIEDRSAKGPVASEKIFGKDGAIQQASEFVQEINSDRRKLEAAAAEALEDDRLDEYEQLQGKALELEALENNFKNRIHAAFNSAQEGYQSKAPLYKAIEDNNIEALQEIVVNKETSSADKIYEDFNRLGEEDYEGDPTTIETALDKVELIERVFTNRDDVNQSFKTKTIKRMQDYRKVLEKALQVTLSKSEQRQAAQKRSENEKINSITEAVKALGGNLAEGIESWPEAQIELEKFIEANKKGLIDKIDKKLLKARDTIIQLYTDLTNLPVANTIRTKLHNNPTLHIPFLLYHYIGPKTNGAVSIPGTIHFQFKMTHDFDTYMRELVKENKEMYDELLPIYEGYRLIKAYNNIKETARSTVKIKDIVEAENEVGESIPFKPTFQQHFIIHRALNVLMSKVLPDTKELLDFKDFIVVNGTFGTGKTKVVAKWIVETFLKLKQANHSAVMAAGHSKTSTDNLKNIIKPKDANDGINSIEDVIKADWSNIQLIVIDEALAMKTSTLVELQKKVREHNAENKNKIRVLALGDPSQNKLEEYPILASQSSDRAATMDPLTVIYRTNVASISGAAMSFKDKAQQVTTLSVVSNTSEDQIMDEEDPSGVLNMSKDNIVKKLSLPSSKKRALIVNNPAEAQHFQELVSKDVKVLDTTDVVDYLHAQGSEWEEVYIILNPGKNSASGTPFNTLTFNTAVYTSIGRGTKFVGINLGGISVRQITDTELNETTERAKEDIDKIVEDYNERLAVYSKLLGVNLTPAKKTATTTKTDPNEDEGSLVPSDDVEESLSPNPEIINDDGENTEAETRIKTSNKINTNEDSHYLAFPTNAFLKENFKDQQGNSLIDLDTPLHIVKVRKGRDDVEYHVLAQSTKAKDAYYTVAILGDEDLNEGSFGAFFNSIKDNDVTTLERSQISKNKVDPSMIPTIGMYSLGTVKAVSYSQLKVRYDAKNPKTKPTGKDNWLNDVITRFYNSFFQKGMGGTRPLQPAIQYFKDGELNWDKLGNNMKIHIFNKKEIEELPVDATFRPNPGIPYLVIESPSWLTKTYDQARVYQNLYIRLEAKKLSIHHPYFRRVEDFLKSYDRLIALLVENNVTTHLADPFFKNLIQDFSERYEVVVDATTGQKSIQVKRGAQDFSEWKQSIGEIENIADEKSLQTLLDDLVRNHLYGPLYKEVEVTYGAYKELAESDDQIADYETVDPIIKRDKITDSDKVKIVLKKDEEGTQLEYKMGWQLSTDQSPLALAYNAISTANKNLPRGVVFKDKNANAIMWSRIRRYILPFIKENSDAIIKEGIKPMAYTWLTAKKKERKYRVTWRTDEMLKIMEHMFQNPTKFKLPDENAFTEKLKEIEHKYADIPIDINSLRIITSVTNERSKTIYTPLFRNDPKTENMVPGINSIGENLQDPANREYLQEQLQTNFETITPTHLEVAIPKQPKTAQQNTGKKDKYDRGLKDQADVIKILKFRAEDPNIDEYLRRLIKLILQQDLDKIGWFLSENPAIPDGALAAEIKPYKEYDVVVHMSPKVFNSLNTKKLLPFLVHEAIHALTSKAINSPQTEADIQFKKEIKELQKLADKEFPDKSIYANTKSKLDEHEFIANLSNPEFYKKLKKSKLPLLERLWESILKWLGVTDTNLYDATFASFEKFLSQGSPNVRTAQQPISDRPIKKPTKEEQAEIDRLTKEITEVFELIEDDYNRDPYYERLDEILGTRSDAGWKIQELEALYNDVYGVYTNFYHFASFVDSRVASMMDPDLAKTFVSGWLPNIGKGDTNWIKIVSGILLKDRDGYGMWARIRDAALTLGTNLDNKVYRNTAMHEVVHITHRHGMNSYWQDKLKRAMVREYGEHIKDMTPHDYEHMLAKLWENIDIIPNISSNIIVQFFKDVTNLTKYFFSNKNELEKIKQLFESGYFSAKVSSIDLDYKADFSLLNEHFDDLEVYRMAKAYVANKMNRLLNNGIMSYGQRVMLTRADAVALIKEKYLPEDITNIIKSIETASIEANDPKLSKRKREGAKEKVARAQVILEAYKQLAAGRHRVIGTTKSIDGVEKFEGVSILSQIIKDIYPNWHIRNIDTKISLDNYSEEVREMLAETELLSSEAISQETAIRDYENEEVKLSSSVKDFLSFIIDPTKSKWDRNRFIPHSYAFVRSVQLMMDYFDLNNLELLEEQLQTTEKSEDMSDWSRAVLNRLVKLFRKVRDIQHPRGLEDVQIHLVTTKQGTDNLVMFASVDGSDISEKSYEELQHMFRHKKVVQTFAPRASKVNVPQLQYFRERLQLRYPDRTITQEEVNTIYEKNYIYNVANEIQNHIGSLVEKNYYIGASESNYGSYDIKYHPGTDLGVNTDLTNEIVERIATAIIDGKIDSNLKNRTYINSENKEVKIFDVLDNPKSTPEQNKDALKALFTLINIDSLLGNTQFRTTDKLINDVKGFIERTVDIPEESKIDKFIEDQKGFITSLKSILKNNHQLLKNSSVLDGENKKLYKYVVGSFGHRLLNTLSKADNSRSFFKGKGNQSWRVNTLPDYIKTPFYSYNTIVNGLQSITKPNTHDMAKNKYTGKAWPFRAETKRLWYSRNFVSGFLAMARDSRSNDLQYGQFFFQPSDNARISFTKMKVLDKSQIIESIRNAQEQLKYDKYFDPYKNIIGFDGDKQINAKTLLSGTPEQVYQTLVKMSLESLKEFMEVSPPIPDDLRQIYIKLGLPIKPLEIEAFESGFPSEFAVDKEIPKQVQSRISGEYNSDIATFIQPAYTLFFLNHFVNSYFLNQLTSGPYDLFKDSKDIVKRQSAIWGPTQQPRVGNGGTKEKFTTLILKDTKRKKEITIRNFLEELFKNREESERKRIIEKILKGFEDEWALTDGGAFMTQSRWFDLAKGYGRAYNLGRIMKPMHFEIITEWNEIPEKFSSKAEAMVYVGQNPGHKYLGVTAEGKHIVQMGSPVPIYLKNSTVVLSDDLLEQYPELKSMNDRMIEEGIDEIHFNAGSKVAKYKGSVDFQGFISGETYDMSSRLELSNRSYGLQFNPMSSMDKRQSRPTQLEYFISLMKHDAEVSQRVYDALAALNVIGENNSEEELGDTESSFRKKLIKMMVTPGNGRHLENLSEGMSIENPSIEMKVIIQLASLFEKNMLSQKFKGGKLILQSPEGITETLDEETKEKASKLGYRVYSKDHPIKERRGLSYVEAIVPRDLLTKEQRQAVAEGKQLFLWHDMFGIRIPTTEIHSAVPIKVVDTYDSYGTNIIIMPEVVGPIQGYDFDVDSTFVFMRENFKSEYTIGNKVFKKGDPVGYKWNTDVKDNSYWEVDEEFLPMLYSNAGDMKSSKVRELQEAYLKNTIIDNVLKVLSNPENFERMSTPISKLDFVDESNPESVISILEKLDVLEDENWELPNPDDSFKSFRAIKEGLQLVGIFANNVKVLAYLSNSQQENSKLNEDAQIQYQTKDGKVRTFDKLVDKDVDTGTLIWQHLDAFINLAVDNAKDLFLYKMNVTSKNANAISALIGLGLPLSSVTYILNNPLYREISSDKYINIQHGIKEVVKERKYDSLETSIVLSDDLLANYSKGEISDENKILIEKAIINLLNSAEKLGDSMRRMSNVLKVLRELPVLVEDMDTFEDSLRKVFDKKSVDKIIKSVETKLEFKDSTQFELALQEVLDMKLKSNDTFVFDPSNVLQRNPHIYTAIRGAVKVKQMIEERFKVHHPVMKEFSKRGIGLKLDPDSNKHAAMVRRALSKYLISYLVTKEIDPLQTKKVRLYGKDVNLNGVQVWTEEFIVKVRKARALAKKEGLDNKFLKHLTIYNNWKTGSSAMKMHSTSNLDEVEGAELRQAFEFLNQIEFDEKGYAYHNPNPTEQYTDFQKDFVKYSILVYGLAFSHSNYASFLPYSIFKEEEQEYLKLVDQFINDQDMRNKIAPHFYSLLAVQNINKLKYIKNTERIEKMDSKKGEYFDDRGNRVYYDLAYTTLRPEDTFYTISGIYGGSQEDIDNAKEKDNVVEVDSSSDDQVQDKNSNRVYVPFFIKSGDKAYLLVDNSGDKIAYQEIGKGRSNIYDRMPDAEEYYLNGHTDYFGYFDPHLRTLRVKDINDKKVVTKYNLKELYERGEPIALVAYGDDMRIHRKFVVITKEPAVHPLMEGTTMWIHQVKEISEQDALRATNREAIHGAIFKEEESTKHYAIADEELDDIVKTGEQWKPVEEEVDGKTIIRKYSNGKVELTRTTEPIDSPVNSMRRNPWTSRDFGWAEKEADTLWAGRDKSEKLLTETSSKKLDYYEYIEHKNLKSKQGAAKGTAGHAILEGKWTEDPVKKAEIEEKVHTVLEEVGLRKWVVEWVDKNWTKILSKAGLNVFDSKVTEDNKDKLRFEVRVASEIWGLASTIDLLVKHANNTYSIIDFKFGKLFNSFTSNNVWKYGRQKNNTLFESARSRAKLEIMFRALLLKTERPDIKFHDLKVLWVPSEEALEYSDTQQHVEVADYLGMIQDYYRNEYNKAKKEGKEKETVWYKLQQLSHFKRLFDPNEYTQGYSSHLVNEANKKGKPVHYLYAEKMEELRTAVQFDMNPYLKSNDSKKAMQERAAELTKELLDIQKRPEMKNLNWDKDLNWLSLWLGSSRDITNPYVQFYGKMLEQQKKVARTRYSELFTRFRELLYPIHKEYYKRTGRIMPPTEKLQATEGLITNINPIEYWEWAYRTEETDDGVVTRRLNHTEEDWEIAMRNYDYLTPENIEQYRKLVDFMINEMSQFFVDENAMYENSAGKKQALANKIATYRPDKWNNLKPVTNLQLHTRGSLARPSVEFKYTKGFFPKIAKTADEFGPWLLRLADPQWRTELYFRMFTWKNETEFDQIFNEDEMMPFRYLGSSTMDASQNYSLNLEKSFLDFMKYHLMKEEVEDVYAMGMGIRHYLDRKSDPISGQSFNNLDKWFKIAMDMNIRGRRQTHFAGGLFGREPGVPFSPLSKSGARGKTYRFDWVKFLRWMKSSTSSTVMGLKIFQGTANTVFANLYTVKDAMKDEIIKSGIGKWMGIDGDQISFTPKDLVHGYNEFRKMQGDAMKGEIHKNKLWLLAKQFGYMTDEMDLFNHPDALLSTRSQITNGSYMYMFYSLPEEALAYAIMGAQLNRMKFKQEGSQYDGMSLYDMYDVQEVEDGLGNIGYKAVWKEDAVRGLRDVSKDPTKPDYQEIKELTTEEIQRLKYVYQKMHGGYRQDERVAFEYFVLGEMFMQFKRYLPTVLKNMGQSKGQLLHYGVFKPTGEMKDGKEILEWHSRIVEGRWRTLGGMFFNFLSFKLSNPDNPNSAMNKILTALGYDIPALENYNWSNLEEGQREFLVDFAVTMIMWGSLFATSLLLFGSADEDDPYKVLTQRVMNNFSQQWNITEPVRDIMQNGLPSSWKVHHNRMFAVKEMLVAGMMLTAGYEDEAFTRTGTLKGFNRFAKYTPYTAAWYDAVRYLGGESDPTHFTYRILK